MGQHACCCSESDGGITSAVPPASAELTAADGANEEAVFIKEPPSLLLKDPQVDYVDCQRGDPLRALSVHWLQTGFLKDLEVASLPASSKIYDIEEKVLRGKGLDITCPRTGKPGCSYVDAIDGMDNAGRANVMLSYTWGYRVCEIVDSLSTYCTDNDINPKRFYVWICCVCVNQHRVQEKQKAGEVVSFDDFKQAFGETVKGVERILVLMSPWHEPYYLTRIWCIFEFGTAIKEQKSVHLMMPPEQQKNFYSDIFGTFMGQVLFSKLASVCILDATASIPNDKVSILKYLSPNNDDYIHSESITSLNRAVRDRLRAWFVETIAFNLERYIANGNANLCSVAKGARVLFRVGKEVERPRKLLEMAMDGVPKEGNEAAWALYWKGKLSLADNSYGDAKGCLLDAIEAASASPRPDPFLKPACLQVLGYMLRGEESLHYFEEACSCLEDAGRDAGFVYASKLLCIVQHHYDHGNWTTAVELGAASKAAFEADGKSDKTPDYATLLMLMGMAFEKLGRSEIAWRFFFKADEILKATGEGPIWPSTDMQAFVERCQASSFRYNIESLPKPWEPREVLDHQQQFLLESFERTKKALPAKLLELPCAEPEIDPILSLAATADYAFAPVFKVGCQCNQLTVAFTMKLHEQQVPAEFVNICAGELEASPGDFLVSWGCGRGFMQGKKGLMFILDGNRGAPSDSNFPYGPSDNTLPYGNSILALRKTASLADGEWHTVVLAYDAQSGTCSASIDGMPYEKHQFKFALPVYLASLCVGGQGEDCEGGKEQARQRRWPASQLTDVRVYNRVLNFIEIEEYHESSGIAKVA